MMRAASAEEIRLSLRELAEIPYRALRVSGASHGEAQESAAAVQFAELHESAGLTAALTAARRGWPSTGLALTRTDSGDAVSYVASGNRPVNLLQTATNLIDLASSTGRPTRVRVSAGALDSSIDRPLLTAAVRSNRPLCAVQPRDEQVRVRLATPRGDLACAVLDADSAIALFGPSASIDTVIAALDALPESLLRSAQVRSCEALRSRRVDAARTGVHVDREVWDQLRGAASEYQLPDREGQ